jgi:hypothetical protein
MQTLPPGFANPSEAGAPEHILQRSSPGTPRSSLDATRLGTRRLAGEPGPRVLCHIEARRKLRSGTI